VLHAALEKVEDAGSKASLQTTLAATKLLEDHSVRLEGDVSWQEVHLQFEFDKPTNVEEIRLELCRSIRRQDRSSDEAATS